MNPAQALLQAYQTGDVLTIAEAECEYMDATLAAYGDVGSLQHSEPPGYAERFAEVMDEMQAIEALHPDRPTVTDEALMGVVATLSRALAEIAKETP